MIQVTRHGWIGVDVGSAATKLAQLCRRGSQLELRTAHILQRWEPWADDLHAAPAYSLRDDLVAGLSAGGVARRAGAACSLSMAICQHRVASLSRLAGADSDEALLEAIADATDKSHDQVFAYWESAAGFGAAAAESEAVNLVSLPQRWIDQVIEDFRSARLTCRVLDAVPHALARAVHVHRTFRHGIHAALDWGHSGWTFCVIREAVPVYVRRFREGGLGSLAQAVHAELGLEAADARQLVRRVGLPLDGVGVRSDAVAGVPTTGSPCRQIAGVVANVCGLLASAEGAGQFVAVGKPLDPADAASCAVQPSAGDAQESDAGEPSCSAVVWQSIAGQLEAAVDQLNRTLDFLKSHVRQIVPEQIHLFGGGALLPGAEAYLSKALPVPVHRWELPAELRATRQARELAPLIAPALALSLLAWENAQ